MKPWHIVVVALVFLLFFGIPKLPELARAIGRSLRIFKSETKGLMEDDVRGKADAQTRHELSDLSPETGGEPDTKQPLTGDVMNPAPEHRDKR